MNEEAFRLALTEREEDECTKAWTDQESTAVSVKMTMYVSLPTKEAHTGHYTESGVAGFAQRVNPQVATRIAEIVAEGIIDKSQVHSLFHHYVMHKPCKEKPPNAMIMLTFP